MLHDMYYYPSKSGIHVLYHILILLHLYHNVATTFPSSTFGSMYFYGDISSYFNPTSTCLDGLHIVHKKFMLILLHKLTYACLILYCIYIYISALSKINNNKTLIKHISNLSQQKNYFHIQTCVTEFVL